MVPLWEGCMYSLINTASSGDGAKVVQKELTFQRVLAVAIILSKSDPLKNVTFFIFFFFFFLNFEAYHLTKSLQFNQI